MVVLAVILAPTRCRIPQVVLLGSQAKVLRIDATWLVALMPDYGTMSAGAFRNGPIGEFEREPVCFNKLAADAKTTVPTFVQRTVKIMARAEGDQNRFGRKPFASGFKRFLTGKPRRSQSYTRLIRMHDRTVLYAVGLYCHIGSGIAIPA